MDKILKKNFTYLFILQNANYILPLLLLPYLTRVLGAENFGKVAFAQAFISYFVLLTDFGFNTSSTQAISKVQHKKLAVSKIFWSTIYAKLFFAIVSLLLLSVLIYGIPKLNLISNLLYVAYIGVISSVLFPTWLFQGIEKMAFITWLSIVPRISVLLITFTFIKTNEDYLLALQIQVGGILFTAILSAITIFYKKFIFYRKPSLKDIYNEIYESWPIFVSGVATNIYTTTNIVVLGFLTNNSIVGIYSAADKVIRAIISLSSSITQVTFPRINIYYLESKDKALKFARKLLKVISVLYFIGSFLIIFFAFYIVKILFGLPEYRETITILRISSFTPFFAIVNGIIAVNVFITFNLKHALLKIVGLGGICSILMVFPLTYYFKAEGVALCALITEMIILFLLIQKLKSNKINLFI